MTNKKYEFCLFLECVKFTDGVSFATGTFSCLIIQNLVCV